MIAVSLAVPFAVLASTFGFSSLIAVSLASDFSLFVATCSLLVLVTLALRLVTVALIMSIVSSAVFNRVSTLSAAFTAPTPLVNTNAAATIAAFLPFDLANSDVTT